MSLIVRRYVSDVNRIECKVGKFFDSLGCGMFAGITLIAMCPLLRSPGFGL